MADQSPFWEAELVVLDQLATEEGVPSTLVRALLAEQARPRSDGRAGLRASIDALLDSVATDTALEAGHRDAD